MAAADDVDGGSTVRHLEAELERHPEDRYPVQHATGRFHLGTLQLSRGDAGAAAAHLRVAVRLFERMPVERAKSLNLLGVALRDLGDRPAALDAFARAAKSFRGAGRALEEGAAVHNRGLVALDGGDATTAERCFRQALQLFDEHEAPAQAAAAGRELGALLLRSGRPEAAVPLLRGSVHDADRAGDRAAMGAAANVAGLAHLALGEADEAAASFRVAAGAHPRGVRPDGYAMAKANLALALEQAGDHRRARLAARQARDVPGAPGPVTTQARAVLERLPGGEDDLWAILDDEPRERWPALAREEITRWPDASAPDQREAAAALVDAQLRRRADGPALAELWLSVILELPPTAMELLIERIVDALAVHEDHEQERVRRAVARGMAAFHVPQLLRLRQAFDDAAARAGVEGSWS